MELKPGYKQTEVGVIPEDWEVSFLSSATLKIQDGTHFSPKLGGNDFLYITSKNIRHGYIDLSKVDRIDTEQHKAIYKRCDVKYGDLLLTKDGASTGNAAFNSMREEFSLLSSVALLRFDSNKHDANYFLQQILSQAGQQRISEAMSGNAITRLTLDKIKKLVYPIPPTKTEQTAIANTLSDADALIQSLASLIAKKRRIKQGAMQTLLNPYENGRLKEGWVMKKLGDCLDKIVGGGTPSRSVKSYWGKEIPWVTVKDFSSFSPFSTQEYITTEGLKHSATNIIPRGTIIIATRMALGRAVIYDVDVCINQDLKAIFPKLDVCVLYLKHWLEKNASLIEELGSGSTVMGVSLEDLRKIEFSMPSKENQTRIATILSDIDAEIAALEAKLAKYQHIKQGMMQNLLTGRIRLVKPDNNTGAAA